MADLLAEECDITPIGVEAIADILTVSVDELLRGDGFDVDHDQFSKVSELARISPRTESRVFQVGGSAT